MFSQNVYHFTSLAKFDCFLFETVAFKKKKFTFEKFQDNSTSTKASALDTH